MIVIKDLCKQFPGPLGTVVDVLRNIDLDVADRTITAVIGPSGAGKTTLSKCISLLETPTSGSVLVNGKNLSRLTGAALRTERRAIGTIFQSSALLRRKTAAENVRLPLEYLGVVRLEIDRRVAELLEHVGLADKANVYPGQLSGGQRQRVGIARALALHPSVLLADEATSGLDPQATESILALLKTLRDELALSIILITHEMDVVRTVADQVAVLQAGQIVEHGRVRDVIADPRSSIGRLLLPIKPSAALDPTLLTFEISYGSDTNVPLDWISVVSATLRARVNVLGGVIEEIGSRPAGRLRISLAYERAADESAEHAVSLFARLGLVATRSPGTARESEFAAGAV